MQLLFLGSGSAHTVGTDNFQSNMMLISDSGRRLLIDCGSDVRWSLAKQGLSHLDVTDIYISHLHADHIGGLECIGFQTKFDSRCKRPHLYIEASLAAPLWNRALRGGMGVISGTETELNSFFDVRAVTVNQPFEWEGARLEPIAAVHVSCPQTTVHSYGLLIERDEHRTFLTTDTQFTPAHLHDYYVRADLIFHDCETGQARTGVHPNYDDLVQLPPAFRAKTWLYGYPPGPLPDAVGAGFRGFVRAGQSFDLMFKRGPVD
ncbi:MAG TPA: MBL fold metallo-hydrolase [Burkholderiales bacterium]|nr:MBL fold metallo-hydrolase [Burkholderiales bacterium]